MTVKSMYSVSISLTQIQWIAINAGTMMMLQMKLAHMVVMAMKIMMGGAQSLVTCLMSTSRIYRKDINACRVCTVSRRYRRYSRYFEGYEESTLIVGIVVNKMMYWILHLEQDVQVTVSICRISVEIDACCISLVYIQH